MRYTFDKGAASWHAETEYDFSPAEAISWNCESKTTLNHRRYGPPRDFPMPECFDPRRWSATPS
jgi:hypothetical protein